MIYYSNMDTNNVNYKELKQLMDEVNIMLKRGNINVVSINEQKLVVYQDGTIYRLKSTGNHKLIPNIVNTNDGYNTIGCNGKMFYRHRIIAFAYLKLDIYNVKSIVDHIDKNKLNNNINNLSVKITSDDLNNLSKKKIQNDDKKIYTNKYLKKIES